MDLPSVMKQVNHNLISAFLNLRILESWFKTIVLSLGLTKKISTSNEKGNRATEDEVNEKQ